VCGPLASATHVVLSAKEAKDSVAAPRVGLSWSGACCAVLCCAVLCVSSSPSSVNHTYAVDLHCIDFLSKVPTSNVHELKAQFAVIEQSAAAAAAVGGSGGGVGDGGGENDKAARSELAVITATAGGLFEPAE